MKRPDVIEGTYTFQNREVVYRTKCPHCVHLAQCKKRRMPECPKEDVGWVRFLVGGDRKAFWSGVIELKKIARIVHDYLENDPPADVALPAEQMRFEELDGA